MKIGIDGSRAFLQNRTGIEEYSYQVIKHLTDKLNGHQVVLYIRKGQVVDFELPANFVVKVINWPRFWTQLGMSLEMLFHRADVLFVPAHTVPFIHPQKTFVVVHGLEYEFCPQAYSAWEKFYMRFSIKNSCRWASKIISVSENTKKDLISLYGVEENKIEVIYEGYETEERIRNQESRINSKFPPEADQPLADKIQNSKFILFVGRIEERKNIVKIIEAFEILKEKYNISHKLVLAGKPGYGYEYAKKKIENTRCKNDIIELGYVSEQEKWQLLKKAEIFIFPTQYEGFGIPVLEAQCVGCPVVASDNSSLPEVLLSSAHLVDPHAPQKIAESIYSILSDERQKNAIIAKGLENVKRFSWEKCAQQIAKLLND